jgi:hypothetical protein
MEQLKKNKKAFISLDMGLFFDWMENGALLLWKVFKNGTGGRRFFLVLNPVFVWEMEMVKIEKIGLANPALGFRLHACSAWEVNVKKAFVFAMDGAGFFLPKAIALTPHTKCSLFRLKIYFNSMSLHDPNIHAQTTLHSYDLPEERLGGDETQAEIGGFFKPLQCYNGYIFQVRYCYKLFSKNALLYAKIYNNQSVAREELDHLHAGNILIRMAELNLPRT